jgi:hypothetical protein
MALKYSTALREGLAVGGSLRSLINNSLVRIYSGTIPANADAALGSAVLLNQISAGGTGTPLTFEPTAPGGLLRKSVAENWTGNNVAGGTPSFFRLVLPADTGNASATEVRIQGTCGGLGNDLVITELPLVEAAPQSFELFQLAIPEQ